MFNKKYRKSLALILTLALSTTIFTGCGGTETAGNNTNVEKQAEETQDTENTADQAEETNEEDVKEDQELVDFNVGHLSSNAHLLFFVAKEEGYFEEEGLNVTLYKFSNAAELLSGVESGKLNAAAVGSPQTTNYIAQGHEISVIGGIMSKGHALLVKKEALEGVDEKDYGDLTKLKGLRIAQVPDATEDIIWTTGLKEAGLTVGEDLEFVDVDSGTAAYTALQNDDIDGALLFTPYHALAEQDGYVTFDYSNEIAGFENHPCCRNVALTEEVKANPDLYKKYLKALIKAYKFYKENEDGTIEDIKKYVDVDSEIIRAETYAEFVGINPDPDQNAFVSWTDAMSELGYFDKFDVTENVITDVYKSALDEIVEEYPDDAAYQELVEHYSTYDE